jgi:NAD(P)-dependent dehydrogenase (short-subunit alcohol dehydrogenase family)
LDRFDLSGRVAVVTGGTRGLGLAMARGFAQVGAEVVVVSRKPDACDEVAAALRAEGGKAAASACHVGHWDEIETLVDDVYRDFGRVDVLVNNAGVSPMYDKLSDVTEELFDKVIAVNLKGPFRLAALVGERMIAGEGGSIINVSSTGAVRPTSDIVPYFLTTISQAWDMDIFNERARTFPARRAGDADEIVGAALYLASDASSYTTGTILTVDGGAQWSMAGTGAGNPT